MWTMSNVLILLQLYANKNLEIGTGVYQIKKAQVNFTSPTLQGDKFISPSPSKCQDSRRFPNKEKGKEACHGKYG